MYGFDPHSSPEVFFSEKNLGTCIQVLQLMNFPIYDIDIPLEDCKRGYQHSHLTALHWSTDREFEQNQSQSASISEQCSPIVGWQLHVRTGVNQ